MASMLGEILVAKNWVTQAQLDDALQTQSAIKGRLGTNLVELGALDVDKLAQALSEQRGFPAALRKDFDAASPITLVCIPAPFTKEFSCFPIRREAGKLVVAFASPFERSQVEPVRSITGMEVVPYIAPELLIYYYLEARYRHRRPERYANWQPGAMIGTTSSASIPPPPPDPNRMTAKFGMPKHDSHPPAPKFSIPPPPAGVGPATPPHADRPHLSLIDPKPGPSLGLPPPAPPAPPAAVHAPLTAAPTTQPKFSIPPPPSTPPPSKSGPPATSLPPARPSSPRFSIAPPPTSETPPLPAPPVTQPKFSIAPPSSSAGASTPPAAPPAPKFSLPPPPSSSQPPPSKYSLAEPKPKVDEAATVRRDLPKPVEPLEPFSTPAINPDAQEGPTQRAASVGGGPIEGPTAPISSEVLANIVAPLADLPPGEPPMAIFTKPTVQSGAGDDLPPLVGELIEEEGKSAAVERPADEKPVDKPRRPITREDVPAAMLAGEIAAAAGTTEERKKFDDQVTLPKAVMPEEPPRPAEGPNPSLATTLPFGTKNTDLPKPEAPAPTVEPPPPAPIDPPPAPAPVVEPPPATPPAAEPPAPEPKISSSPLSQPLPPIVDPYSDAAEAQQVVSESVAALQAELANIRRAAEAPAQPAPMPRMDTPIAPRLVAEPEPTPRPIPSPQPSRAPRREVAPQAPPPTGNKLFLGLGLGAVVGAALGAGVVALAWPKPPPPPPAPVCKECPPPPAPPEAQKVTVDGIQGMVERLGLNGEWSPIAAIGDLVDGEQVRTGQGSRATLHVGAATVGLGEYSRIAIRKATTDSHRFRLNAGLASFKYAESPVPMELESENGKVSVSGKADLTAFAERARLSLTPRSGEVEVAAGGKKLTLPRGKLAVVAADGALPDAPADLPEKLELALEPPRASQATRTWVLEGAVVGGPARVIVEGSQVEVDASNRFTFEIKMPARGPFRASAIDLAGHKVEGQEFPSTVPAKATVPPKKAPPPPKKGPAPKPGPGKAK